MVNQIMLKALFYFGLLFLLGCKVRTRVDNTPGMPTIHEDPSSPGIVQGIGIESQDIIAVTDKVVRDLLSTQRIAGTNKTPLIIIDEQGVENRTSTRIDKKLIANRLRVKLNREARGRMYFVTREHTDIVEKERLLKREGLVSFGTLKMTPTTAGADFRLFCTIASQDSINRSGITSRYYQFTFELVDLELNILTWSEMYDIKKSAQDDIIYP